MKNGVQHLSIVQYYEDGSCETYHQSSCNDGLHSCYQVVAEPVDSLAVYNGDYQSHYHEQSSDLIEVPALLQYAPDKNCYGDNYDSESDLSCGREFGQVVEVDVVVLDESLVHLIPQRLGLILFQFLGVVHEHYGYQNGECDKNADVEIQG